MEVLTLTGPCPTTARLLAEFRWQVDEAEVSRVVQRCLRDISGVPPAAMPELVERSARQRLAASVGRRPPR